MANLAILIYHAVGEVGYKARTAAQFSADLALIRESGARVVSFSDLIASRVDDKSLGAPAVILSFDDGLAGHAAVVAPALDAAGMRGTFCIVTDPPKGEFPSQMRADELRALARRHEVAYHSNRHRNALHMNLTQIIADLKDERSAFERLGIKAAPVLVPPYGARTPDVGAAALEMGFMAVRTTRRGLVYSGTSLMDLPGYEMADDLDVILKGLE